MKVSKSIYRKRSFGDPIEIKKILPSLCKPEKSPPPTNISDYPVYEHSTSSDYFIYKNPKLIDWAKYANPVFGFNRVDSYLVAQGSVQKNSIAIDTTRSILAFHDNEDLSFKTEQSVPVNENILNAFYKCAWTKYKCWYGALGNVFLSKRKIRSWFTVGNESKIVIGAENDGFDYTGKAGWKCEENSVVWSAEV